MRNRKLLFVTYHYPPDAAVGALRPGKTVRYLRELGWDPHVLTVKERHLGHRDDGRLADVRGVPVIRTGVWPTPSQLALRVRDRLARREWRRRGRPVGNSGPARNGSAGRAGGDRGRLRTALRRYADTVFELPDRQVGWLLPAVWSGYRAIRREDIGLIVTSSPPPTTALVGLVLSRLAGAPLVTDLRDPWISPRSGAGHSTRAADWARRSLERRIVHRSSRIVTTTEQYREYLVARYPEVPAHRFCTIWNGYDPDEFADGPPPRPGTLTIAYLGTFYVGRTPREFLQAVAELVDEGALARSELSIRFVGDVGQAEGESVEELARACGLARCVTIAGPVSHRQALAVMKAADILLLLAPDQFFSIPAKAFEYIGAKRPILCVAREGATASLIRQAAAGVVVAPDDVPGTKRALVELITRRRADSRSSDGTERYERRRLAGEFARVLEECMASGPLPDGAARAGVRVPGAMRS